MSFGFVTARPHVWWLPLAAVTAQSDSAVTPGTSYETVIEVGRMPEVRTRLQGAANQAPGARTFEAQLEDGE